MARVVGLGLQDFSKIQNENVFYVDKTRFIKEWWESKDEVTLIARPRRFGKTLTMSMVEQFFSVEHAGSKCFRVWIYGKNRNIGNYRELIRLFHLHFLLSKKEIIRMQRKKSVQQSKCCIKSTGSL